MAPNVKRHDGGKRTPAWRSIGTLAKQILRRVQTDSSDMGNPISVETPEGGAIDAKEGAYSPTRPTRPRVTDAEQHAGRRALRKVR